MAEPQKNVPVESRSGAPASRESDWMMPFETLRREVDRLFDDFRPMGWRLPFGRAAANEPVIPRTAGFTPAGFTLAPAMDLVERDGAYELTAELPGIDEKNVEVKLANGTLSIRGEKKEEKEEDRKDYYFSERRYGSFQRMVRVPDGVDQDRIEANFRNGVLTVTLPKSEQARASEKKIEIRSS